MTTAMRLYIGVTLLSAAIALAACSAKAPETAGEPAATVVAETPAAAAPAPAPKSEGPVVVFFGDSLTAGYNLPAEDALPAQVEADLKARDIAVKVVNAGVSGDTTQGAFDRYDWSVASAHPSLLIVALGANDYLNGFPADVPKANLAKIIERAQADGVQVALLGVKTPTMTGAEAREQAYAAIYPDLAKQYGVPLYASLLEGVLGKPELVQADGLHPTVEGVAIMAKQIADFLEAPVRALKPASGP